MFDRRRRGPKAVELEADLARLDGADESALVEAESAFQEAIEALRMHGALGRDGKERRERWRQTRVDLDNVRLRFAKRKRLERAIPLAQAAELERREILMAAGIDPDARDADERLRLHLEREQRRMSRTLGPETSLAASSGGGIISVRTRATTKRLPRHVGPAVPGKVRPGTGRR